MEAILSAQAVTKTLRLRSPLRRAPGERLYVIVGISFAGVPIYTKGAIRREGGRDVFYILVSLKRSLP